MEGSQTDLEHHDLKNDMVVTSLEFLFASLSQTLSSRSQ